MLLRKAARAAVMIIGLIVHALAVASSEPTQVRIATEEYPPFTSEHLAGGGIDCAIVREALKLEGIAVEFVFMPPARSFKAGQDGWADATMPWARREGREKYFVYSEPLRPADKQAWFIHRDTRLNWSAESPDYSVLKDKTIAVVNGHNYGDTFNSAVKTHGLKLFEVSRLELAFSMLAARRVDVAIGARLVGLHELNRQFGPQRAAMFRTIPVTGADRGYDHVLVSRHSPKSAWLLDKLNSGLTKFKATAQYQELLSRQMQSTASFTP